MTLPLLTPQEILSRLDAIRQAQQPIGFDTEGQEWMTCCGFASMPVTRNGRTVWPVLVIDTLGLKDKPYGPAIWSAIQGVLEDPMVPKVCWAAGHEREFLQWCHGIALRNYHDAMMLWAERWAELPKRLKYAASILTRLPCWTEGIHFKEDDEEASAHGPALWRYNAHDCVATLQLWLHRQLQLVGVQRERYLFHLGLIEPLNWASQRGIRYNVERAEELRGQLTPQLWTAQAEVNQLAGVVTPATEEAILQAASEQLCNKVQLRKALKGYKVRVPVVDEQGLPVMKQGRPATRAEAINPRRLSWTLCEELANKDCRQPILRLKELAGAEMVPAVSAEVADILDLGLNVKSTDQVVACLNRLGLPPVFKKGARKAKVDGDGEQDDQPSQSKDQEALLKLFLRTGHPITTAILKVVALRGRLQELNRKLSSDGRMRSSFTGGYGTESNRTTSHSWLDGGGGNQQTIPKEPVNFRVLYGPDPGHLWWKLDLTGADLWTVAARLASLGDRTMLDDLLAGIRIPSLVGLMLEHGYRPGSDRAQVKADCKAYKDELVRTGQKWKDTVWKKGSHLTNYGGNAKRIRSVVISDTYDETGTPIDPGLDLCQRVQQLYLSRYWGLPRWWSDTSVKIMRTGKLEMATGQVREFLSKRPRNGKLDDETRREALAAEPQSVTTWFINLALDKLWRDPENWTSGTVGEGEPVIQCLLFVHDELAGQCPIDQRPFLVRKLRAAFDNELTIGRVVVKIPAEGGTGASWGECKEPL